MSEVETNVKKGGKKKLLVILLALVLIAGATVGIVAGTAGYGTKTEVEVSDFAQLKKAVEGTKGKRTIVLLADIEMEDIIVVPEGKTVVITDNGTERTLLRKEGMDRYFFDVLPEASLTVKGSDKQLKLDGGGVNAQGGLDGALIISEGSVTLDNVWAGNNMTESTYGGVVRSMGGAVVLKDSTFANNVAESGAVVYLEGGSLDVDNCVFDGNTGTFGHGGAIYAYKATTLALKNSSFTNNSLPDKNGSYGGAVAMQDKCVATIENCVFDGNTITHSGNAHGGAVFVGNQSKLTVSGKNEFKNNVTSNFEYALGGAIYANEKSTVTIEPGAVFTDNTATHGGALYNRSSTFVVDGAVFTGNKSTIGHGGAMYTYDSGTTTFKNCTFTGNSVIGNGDNFGGAVAIVTNSKCIMESCVYDGNFVDHEGNGYGGAMYIGLKSSLTASGKNVFTNNSAKGTNNALGGALYANTDCFVSFAEGTTFTNNTASHGGALYIAAADAVVKGATFEGNSAWKSHGGAMMTYKADITLEGCVFNKNTVTSPGDFYGGALAVVETSSGIVKNCSFTGNYVDHTGKCRGGAVYVGMTSKLDVSGSTVFDGNYTRIAEDCTGGAIYANTGCVVNLESGTLFCNNRSFYGGAVMITTGAELNAAGVSFVSNTADGRHGGAIMANSESAVTLSGCSFNKNKVTSDGAYYGGALAIVNKSVGKVNACAFDGNYVENKGENAHGGAVYVGLNSTLNVSGASSFANNTVKSELNAFGGAIYANDGCVVNIGAGASFTGNTANRGGAIYANNGAKFVIDGTTFTGNYTTSHHGGAIMAYKSEVAVKNSAFNKNYVAAAGDYFGGAMAIVTNSKATVEASTFEGNYVENTGKNGHGGAIYVGISSTMDVSGASAFTGNFSKSSQDAFGGAIYANDGCVVNIGAGASFTDNTANRGGALYGNTGAKFTVDGVTFTGNHSTGHGGAIMTYQSEMAVKNAVFTGNYVAANSAFYGGAMAVLTNSAVTVEDTTFDGNHVDNANGNSNGGALYVGMTSTLDATGANVFKNNYGISKAAVYGGAIYANNSSVVSIGTGASFTNNKGTAGGALCTLGATINVDGAAFAENKATAGTGGAVTTGNSSGYVTKVAISNSSFTNNTATGLGGAVYRGNTDAGDVTLSDVSFSGNVAGEGTNSNAIAMVDNKGVSLTNVSITSAKETEGDVLISAGGTLSVAGKLALGRVNYADETAMINLVAAVEGTATLVPAKCEEGVQIVKADEASLLTGIGDKFAVVTPWGLNDEGKLVNLAPTVKIGDAEFVTLDEALAVAKDGDTITLVENTKLMGDATVPAGATIVSDGKTITVADGKTLTLEDGVKAENATIIGDVETGDTVDLSGATINGSVTGGEEVILTGAVVTGDVELGDEADLSAAAITGEVTVGDNADLSKATIIGDVTAANAGATDAVIDGTITVAENSVLTVGGSFTANKVHLKTGATVNVATALTAEGKAFAVSSEVETINTQLVTAPDADAVKAAVGKINTAFNDVAVGLGENGYIISDAAVAYILRNNLEVQYETIEDAMDEAAEDEVIVLRKSWNVASTINIDKKVTIDGDGNILTRDTTLTAAAMIKVAPAGELSLSNITLDGNKANVTATVAMIVNEGTLNVKADTTMRNAYNKTQNATASGGAITSKGTLNVTGTARSAATDPFDVVFEGCKSGRGGAIMVTGGTATLQYAKINACEAAAGGGALATGAASTTQITNCEITNCKQVTDSTTAAWGGGGAIYSGHASGKITISYTTIDNCSADQEDQGGGAIHNYAAKDDYKLTVDNCTITNCTAAAYGGAIYNRNAGQIEVTNTTIDTCSANHGGAVTNTGSGSKTTLGVGTLVQKCYVNTTNGGGGAVWNDPGATTEIVGAELKNNTAVNGGAVYNKGGILTIKNSGETKAKITNCTATTNGGAIHNNTNGSNRGNVTVTNAVIDNCNAKAGGFIYVTGADAYLYGAQITNCAASGNGGVAYVTNGTLTSDEGTEISNSTATHGSAIYSNGSKNSDTGVVTNSTVTLTKTTIKNGKAELVSANGAGAIVNEVYGILVLNNGTVIQNNQAVSGGALYNKGKATINEGATIADNKITDTGTGVKKSLCGGAIYNYGTSAELTINGGTFSGNETTNTSNDYGGGVIFNDTGSVVEINGGTFTDNYSASRAGVLYNKGTATISGGTFQRNSAYTHAGVICANGKTTISGGTFENNESRGAGGVILVNNNDVTISGGTFQNNKTTASAAYGGAAYIGKGTTKLTVSGGTFQNNTCEADNAPVSDISIGGGSATLAIAEGFSGTIGIIHKADAASTVTGTVPTETTVVGP